MSASKNLKHGSGSEEDSHARSLFLVTTTDDHDTLTPWPFLGDPRSFRFFCSCFLPPPRTHCTSTSTPTRSDVSLRSSRRTQ